jgi:peptidoglycan/LPS O-acetylase OafA/YrhL
MPSDQAQRVAQLPVRRRPLGVTLDVPVGVAEPVSTPTPVTVSKPVRPASIGHIPSLDGLRALSFLLVFAGHVGLDRYVPGGFGVTVFFFLSGFLITTLMRAEFARTGAVDLRHFWLRRALRILPPFYLVLFAATLAAVAFDPPGTVSGPAVAARALHVTNYWLIFHGYAGEPPGTGVYWSLAVEEHFYLLFPLFYLMMQKLRMPPARQAQLLWGLCALVLLWRCVLVFAFHASGDRTYMASDTRLDSILFGCALAVWKNPVLDEPILRARWWKYVIAPCALLVLAACLLVRSPDFRETARYSLQGAALTFLFVAAIRFHDGALFRVLNWRPLAFVGVLSYSLYLLHYAVILGVQRTLATLHPALQALVALGVSLGAAWIIYRLVEQPCARLRRRLTD